MMPLQSSQAETQPERESGPEDDAIEVEISDEDDVEAAPESPTVLLRGTRAGLEIVIDTRASIDEIAAELTSRLEQSPGFFAGNDACVRVVGRLPIGALARIEQVTARFDLRIVEIGPPRSAQGAADAADPAERDPGPPPEEAEPENAAPAAIAHAMGAQAMAARLVIGPIRSGAVLDASADLIVVGDVNPGAEIQARGNIIVLGRLRGVAHAAVGGECGFIFALRFEPQQLRIGRLVARAGEADAPGQGAEIAYATGRTIVVERYQGRLPSGLVAAA